MYFTAPVITRPPKNATVLLQRRYALPCESSGFPKPKVTWFFNGKSLNSRASNYRISPRSGALRFSRVRVSNTGAYQCQARNKLGKVMSEVAMFTVHAPATFVEMPRDRFVTFGSKIQMRCVVAAIPTPTIHWSRNGAVIKNPRNMTQSRSDSVFFVNLIRSPKVVKSLLHIYNATENAQYGCHASNNHVGGPSNIVHIASVNIRPNGK
ncbi:uncharacterized protein LOC115227782 [Argonauta hians]